MVREQRSFFWVTGIRIKMKHCCVTPLYLIFFILLFSNRYICSNRKPFIKFLSMMFPPAAFSLTVPKPIWLSILTKTSRYQDENVRLTSDEIVYGESRNKKNTILQQQLTTYIPAAGLMLSYPLFYQMPIEERKG